MRHTPSQATDTKRGLADRGEGGATGSGRDPAHLLGGLTLHRVCLECGHGIPLNGPHDVVCCDYCNAELDVRATLDGALDRLWSDPYRCRRRGDRYTVGHGGKLTLAGLVDLREEEPRCQGCKVALPRVRPGTDASLSCGACGAAYETFPPPEAVRARHPYFLQCYGAERALAPRAQREPASLDVGPVLLGCPECGATLTASRETQRVQTCEFCRTDLILPDAVWEHLHPVRVKRRWFVELEPAPDRPAAGPLPAALLAARVQQPRIDTERRLLLNQQTWLRQQGAEAPAGGGVFGRFRLSVKCPSCGTDVPVNGPVRFATCGKCFGLVNVEARVGTWIREFEYGDWALPRDARSCVFAGGALNGTAVAQVAEPRCPGCDATLPRVETGRTEAASCGACGLGFTTFPAPSWLRDHALSVAQCYVCEPEGDPSAGDGAPLVAPTTQGTAPVAFPCLGCGGSLSLGPESARISRCSYCDRDEYLPDDLWFRLHPPRTMKDWYLELGGPLVTDRETAKRAAKGILVSSRAAAPPTPAEQPGPAEQQGGARRVLLIALGLAVAIGLAALAWSWCR